MIVIARRPVWRREADGRFFGMWITPERRRTRWVAPGLAVVAGLAIGGILAFRGQMEAGLVTLGVLACYGLLLACRSGETAFARESLGGGRRSGAHVRAAAVTGDVLVGVTVATLLAQALRGADIWVPAGLVGVAVLTYLLSRMVLTQTY
jgi:hypothetical protein